MCGIAGEIRFADHGAGGPDVEAVARITAAMAPRGPDGSGLHAAGPIALGHRRLKIIDLSERGAQPMVDARARPDRWSSTAASTTTGSCATSWRATATGSSPPPTPR